MVSRHPERIDEIMTMALKYAQIANKEELLGASGYVDLECKIPHVMRQESSDMVQL